MHQMWRSEKGFAQYGKKFSRIFGRIGIESMAAAGIQPSAKLSVGLVKIARPGAPIHPSMQRGETVGSTI